MRRQARERQEKKENFKKKAADFKEAACYPSAVVQGASGQKNILCERSARRNWDPREVQQPFQPKPNGFGYRTTMLRRLLIGAVQFCPLYMCILHIRQKFRTSLSKKIGVNTCFGDGQKVRIDD